MRYLIYFTQKIINTPLTFSNNSDKKYMIKLFVAWKPRYFGFWFGILMGEKRLFVISHQFI